MSNIMYPKYKEHLFKWGIGTGSLVQPTGAVRAALMLTTFSYNAAHEFFSSVSANVHAAQSPASPTILAGAFLDGQDVVFPNVPIISPGTNSCPYLLIYLDIAGSPGTSRLIAFFDNASGLPAIPTGGNINITWNATGIVGL